jgi:hypothetical protein
VHSALTRLREAEGSAGKEDGDGPGDGWGSGMGETSRKNELTHWITPSKISYPNLIQSIVSVFTAKNTRSQSARRLMSSDWQVWDLE